MSVAQGSAGVSSGADAGTDTCCCQQQPTKKAGFGAPGSANLLPETTFVSYSELMETGELVTNFVKVKIADIPKPVLYDRASGAGIFVTPESLKL